MRALPGQAYAHVDTAFLELAEPSIPAGLAALAAQGATEIVAFPYFLAAGTHMAQDIPDAIAEFGAVHPAATVRLTPLWVLRRRCLAPSSAWRPSRLSHSRCC